MPSGRFERIPFAHRCAGALAGRGSLVRQDRAGSLARPGCSTSQEAEMGHPEDAPRWEWGCPTISPSWTPSQNPIVREARDQLRVPSDPGLRRVIFFPECVAKGSRLTLGGLGVELCSRPVASMFGTVGNRPQPFAVER